MVRFLGRKWKLGNWRGCWVWGLSEGVWELKLGDFYTFGFLFRLMG